MRWLFLFLIFTGFTLQLTAQENQVKKFRKLHFAEKTWVIFHLRKAALAERISRETLEATKKILKDSVLDGLENGGQVDAFRHAFWMAQLAIQIGPRAAKKLGIAHEKKNKADFKKLRLEEGQLPDSVSCEMDLQNNKTGIQTGLENSELTVIELQNLIIQQIKNGHFWIIWRNKKGVFLDCKGVEIDISEYRGKWSIPKCLVRSNIK